jgi:hypothetical protein
MAGSRVKWWSPLLLLIVFVFAHNHDPWVRLCGILGVMFVEVAPTPARDGPTALLYLTAAVLLGLMLLGYGCASP